MSNESLDVRSFPGSRHNPQFGREDMERWLPGTGHGYAWMGELGGRRRPMADQSIKHFAMTHSCDADYMETEPFRAGVEDLLGLAMENLWP